MIDTKSYKVYLFNKTPKGEYSPPLEVQLKRFKEHFKSIYGSDPEDVLIGPIKDGEQVFVRDGLVYMPLPEVAESQEPEGYTFTTGYDTPDPSKKT